MRKLNMLDTQSTFTPTPPISLVRTTVLWGLTLGSLSLLWNIGVGVGDAGTFTLQAKVRRAARTWALRVLQYQTCGKKVE